MNQNSDQTQTDGIEIMTELRVRRETFLVVMHLLLVAIFLVLTFASAKRVAEHVVPRFQLGCQIDHGEGLMLGLWRAYHEGHRLYNPIDSQPWLVNNYPPLYVVTVAQLADDVESALRLGRELSFISLILAAFSLAIVVIGVRRGGVGRPRFLDYVAGLIAGNLFVLSPDVMHWGSLMRVDMMAVALSLMGLACASLAGRRKTWPIVLAVLFFLLAISTKHSVVGAPLALILGCFPHRRRRSVKLAFFLALGVGILFVVGWTQTDGQMALHLIRANRTAWSTALGIHHLLVVWRDMGWALIFALFGMGVSLFVSMGDYDRKARTARLVALNYLWITALGLMLTGKSGSSSNYYLEFFAALAITLGLLLADLGAFPIVRCGIRRIRRLPFLLIMLTLEVGMALSFPNLPLDVLDRPQRLIPNHETAQGVKLVVSKLGLADGPILSQDMSLVAQAEKAVMYHPFLMPDLARRGLWFDDELNRMIEEQKFPAIVLSFDVNDQVRLNREAEQFGAMFTAATLRVIRRRYQVVKNFPLLPTSERLVIYQPKL